MQTDQASSACGEQVFSRVEPPDLPAILALQKAAFASVAEMVNNPNIAPMTQTLADIGREFAERVFLKCLIDGTIVGSVRAHIDGDQICHVGRLVVHPGCQDRGIGKALMREVHDLFSDCRAYEIFTGAESPKTLGLYRKLGYIDHHETLVDGVRIVFLRKANG